MPDAAARPTGLVRALRAAVARHPERVALDDGVDRFTYAALGARVGALARALRERAAPGDRVGLLAARDAGASVAFHAGLAAGLVVVPLPSGGPPARARAALDDCGARLVVADDPHARLAEALGRPVVSTAAGTDGAELEPAGPDALAYVLYTSGSTGAPKGVAWDHGGAAAFPAWARTRLALTPDDRVAAVAPLTFDLATFDLFAALAAGAEVRLPPREALLFPRTLAGWVADARPTVLYAVPTLYRQLVAAGADLSSLRAAVFAGEVFPISELARLCAAAPSATLENWYGPTETNVCTAHRVDAAVAPDDPPLSIGRALPHFRVVSPEPGARGELVVEGDAVHRGYWGALVDDRPRRHATGDVVTRAEDGRFTFHGREDRMVKVRGHRVELGEVEHALSRHPDVREVAAIAGPDGLRVYYVADPDPGARRLRAHCAGLLPAYMVPAELTRLDALPRTATGKVALRELG